MLTKLSGIILAMLLICGTAGSAKAADWCSREIRHERHELNEAVRHHGYYSWQADHQRRDLDRVRDQCRQNAYRHDYDHNRYYDRDYR
jgi:hypothetical protein